MCVTISYKRKLNKNNKLVKVIKETYLRKSVPCGFKCCSTTPIELKIIKQTRQRIMIPSSYIIKNYLPLLESDYINCIIPYTEISGKALYSLKDKYFIFRNDLVGMDIHQMCDFYISHTNHCFEVLDEHNIEDLPRRYTNSDEIEDLISRPIEETICFNKHRKTDRVGVFMANDYDGSGVVYVGNERVFVSKTDVNRALSGDKVYLDGNKIVGIQERSRNPITGVIIPDSGTEYVLVRPMQRNIPLIRIRTRQLELLTNQRILVSVEGWLRNSKYPHGNYLRRIGAVGDIETEIQAILARHGIIDSPHENLDDVYLKFLDSQQNAVFSGKTIELKEIDNFFKNSKKVEKPNISGNLKNNEIEKIFGDNNVDSEFEPEQRIDLRDKIVFSIDPPGCTDVDDALHVEEIDDGYEVGVHIADVGNYVELGSKLDKIALQRGTTTYLVDRRIEMLPKILSSNLCSLIENVQRLAFSVIFRFNKRFQMMGFAISKTIIKNRKNFTYEEAMTTNDPEFKPSIDILSRIARKLRGERMARGALDISCDEYRYEYENSCATRQRKGDFKVKLQVKKPLETNRLIEEFMVLANVTVAKFLYKNIPEIALLRKHPKCDIFNPNTQNEVFNRRIIARNMFPASYCSGLEDDFYHFGLATNFYTHFTSPIRRYADLVVHRVLHMIMIKNKKPFIVVKNDEEIIINKPETNLIGNNPVMKFHDLIDYDYSPVQIQQICESINVKTRAAKNASRDCSRIFLYLYIRDVEETLEAIVMEILNGGIVVFVPDFEIEGVIDNPEWSCSKYAVYKKGKVLYKLYDQVKVKIIRDDEMFFLHNKFNLVIV
ncbi:Exosome complex exonuclease RRP44 [Dictyocoela muelleri]|nr:Exosome complex exonuclease RRP44 [Dictyocoela muelleri]